MVDTLSSNINMLLLMIHFYRFATLISAIIIGLILLWFGLRTYGLSRTLMEHQTPLVEKLSKIKNIEWQKELPSSTYQQISVHYNQETWYVGLPENKRQLKEFLASKPHHFLILNVFLSDNRHTATLKTLIDKEKYWERIIFTAPVESTLTTLRELSPQWTFTTGPMFLVRFSTLASLKLESLMDIKADVLFIDPNAIGVTHNLNLLIDEAIRQKKYILIGPVPKPWDELGPIGWVIDKTE